MHHGKGRQWPARLCFLTTALLGGAALAHPLHDCALRLSRDCLVSAEQGVDDIDVPDEKGNSPFFVAVRSALDRKSVSPAELAAIQYLLARGAERELAEVQSLLRTATNPSRARAIRTALSDPAIATQRREALTDIRIRKDLGIPATTLEKIRANLDRLRQSGRFQDYYVAYAASRSIDDAKKAQELARTDKEREALEHMALLTVPDLMTVFSPTLALDAERVTAAADPGTHLIDLDRLTAERDVALFIKVRQLADPAVRLAHAAYRIHLSVDLRFASAAGKVQDTVNVSLPVALRIAPPDYVGAADISLAAMRSALIEKSRAVGGGSLLSPTMELQIVRIERLQ